jgi:formylglycine-generating enzyme required for sulfatase activity
MNKGVAILAAVLVALGIVRARVTSAQTPPPCEVLPLGVTDVVNWIKDVSVDHAIRMITNCGVTFIADDAIERQLRAGGATDALIALVAPPKRPAPGEVWTPRTDGRAMAWAPPGSFTMGSAPAESGGSTYESQHTVQIGQGVWVDTTEVTKQAYQKFVLARPEWQKNRIDRTKHDGSYLQDWDGSNFKPGEGRLPVTFVSWYAAAAYAAWAGKRLPGEAEWEYAARAGTKTAYWWGDSFDSTRANNAAAVRATGGDATRNPWGLYDMLGNVWEWTASLARPYPYASGEGLENAQASGPRSIRGGAAGFSEKFLRSANRNNDAPETTSNKLGFRCVR